MIMKYMAGVGAVALAVAAFLPASLAAEKPHSPKSRQLSLESKPWQGDFDQMLERRMIRMLIPYSRTLFYVDKGRERGISADTFRDVERYLNKKHAKKLGKRPLTVYLVPTTRDKLFSELNAGRGDIAAANLTVTEARLKVVDFVAPRDITPVQELIVTARKRQRFPPWKSFRARPCTWVRPPAIMKASWR
jgi:membrane-bound lytic murein transglycosylase MltF